MRRPQIWQLDEQPLLHVVAPDVIGVSRDMPPAALVDLVVDRKLRFCLNSSSRLFENQMQTARIMIMQPDTYLTHPVSSVLGQNGNALKLRVQCDARDKKDATLAEVDEVVRGIPGARSVREAVVMAADEMYTNASKNSGPLTEERRSKKPGQIQFFVGSDQGRVVLACSDTYGELQLERMMGKVQNCYRQGVTQSINQGPGGAGIGTYLIFENACALYIGVEKSRRTVVACAFAFGVDSEETNKKSIHIFLDHERGK